MEILATKFMPSETVDYILVPDAHDDNDYCVKLLCAHYRDVVYKYAKIQFVENLDTNVCTLKFNYVIIYCPQYETLENLKHDEKFKNYIGTVLEDILENNKFETKQHGE